MNFIDAIEGTGCAILHRLHRSYIEGSGDDSEFICNVKMVIEGIEAFILAHAELMIQPDVVVRVLRKYARQLWLEGGGAGCVQEADGTSPDEDETAAYRRYYFDYIYQHGVYPR
jgi:hypothetical protein